MSEEYIYRGDFGELKISMFDKSGTPLFPAIGLHDYVYGLYKESMESQLTLLEEIVKILSGILVGTNQRSELPTKFKSALSTKDEEKRKLRIDSLISRFSLPKNKYSEIYKNCEHEHQIIVSDIIDLIIKKGLLYQENKGVYKFYKRIMVPGTYSNTYVRKQKITHETLDKFVWENYHETKATINNNYKKSIKGLFTTIKTLNNLIYKQKGRKS